MRRLVATALAVAAVVATVALIAAGASCGIEATRQFCSAEEGCGPPVRECIPFIDPLLWPALGMSALSVVAAWRARPLLPLAVTVVAAAFGIFVHQPELEIGGWIIVTLLLLTGLMTPSPSVGARPTRAVKIGAIVAALLPLVVVPLLYTLTPQPSPMDRQQVPPEWALHMATFLPMVAWLMLLGWRVSRTRPVPEASA